MQHDFVFQDRNCRILHEEGRWFVIDGDRQTSGPRLIDAMEALFGPLHDRELTRMAVELLHRREAEQPESRGTH